MAAMRGGPFLDAGKDARPSTRKFSSSSLEDFSTRALEVDILQERPRTEHEERLRPRLKRSDTWAAGSGKVAVPKLNLPGAGAKAARQAAAPEKDTAKLLQELQATQAALKQEEDQVHQLRAALSEKDTNASSSDPREAPKAKKKGGILPSWMRNIIDKANQLMRPAATEFFPDKPYSQQRFTAYETADSPGAAGQVRRTSFVRRNSFRKSRTLGNLEPLDHSASQLSLSTAAPEGQKERRRNSSVPAHMASRMSPGRSITDEELKQLRRPSVRDLSPKDTGRRSRRTRRNSEVRPSS